MLFIINSKAVILILKQFVMSKSIYYVCLVIGISLIILSEFQDPPFLIIQICGLGLLMLALYQLSKGIEDRPTKDSYIENEEEEE